MNEEQMKSYLGQGRIITTIDKNSGLLFWKNKKGGYTIEINERMKMTVDGYTLEEDGTLSFQINDEMVFRTGIKIEYMTYLNDIIGRVFEFKGGHAWLFVFSNYFETCDCMYWEEDGYSEYRRYPTEEMYRKWHDNEIIGQATAEICTETLGAFIKNKVVDI